MYLNDLKLAKCVNIGILTCNVSCGYIKCHTIEEYAHIQLSGLGMPMYKASCILYCVLKALSLYSSRADLIDLELTLVDVKGIVDILPCIIIA